MGDSEKENALIENGGKYEDETRASQCHSQNHKLKTKPLHIELQQLDPELVISSSCGGA